MISCWDRLEFPSGTYPSFSFDTCIASPWIASPTLWISLEFSDRRFAFKLISDARVEHASRILSVGKDGYPSTLGRLADWGYCALRRSQVRRIGQICLIDADKPTRFMFLDIFPGGVMYAGGKFSDVHRLLSNTVGVVWLLRSLLSLLISRRQLDEVVSSKTHLDKILNLTLED